MDAILATGFFNGTLAFTRAAGADTGRDRRGAPGDAGFQAITRQRRESNEGGGLYFRRLRAFSHGDREIRYVRAGDWERAIAGSRRSLAANGRRDCVGAGTQSEALSRKAASDRADRSSGGPGGGV